MRLETAQVAQHQGRALLFRQRAQRPREKFALLPLGDGFLRSGLFRALVIERDHLHSAPVQIVADVDHDSIQPVGEWLTAVEARQIFMDAQKDLLRGVLGVFPIAAHEAQRGTEHQALVAPHEVFEGCEIARFGALDDESELIRRGFGAFRPGDRHGHSHHISKYSRGVGNVQGDFGRTAGPCPAVCGLHHAGHGPAVQAQTARPSALPFVRLVRWETVSEAYVHGYDRRENERLLDQAGTLVDLLHCDTSYPAGSSVLEAGCGVGAQTVTLARRSPGARFLSVDVSANSLAEAKRKTDAAGMTNVQFRQADIFALPFEPASFDHVFVCFVLEHLSRPVEALVILKRLLRPGGTMTVIEGDHGSTYFHPDSSAARAAVQCLVELQRRAGGNSLIGRQLYPLMVGAGLEGVHVSPRMVYVDSSKPDLVEGFTRKTFTAMIEGVRDAAIAAGMADAESFDAGVRDLYRTAEADGVFCYTFFKGVAQTARPSVLPLLSGHLPDRGLKPRG